MGYQEFTIEGRNAVIEAYGAGKPIDKLFSAICPGSMTTVRAACRS